MPLVVLSGSGILRLVRFLRGRSITFRLWPLRRWYSLRVEQDGSFWRWHFR
jgi:hypothetical protein